MLLYAGKILVADLADGRVDVIDYDDEMIEKTVGGIGLAADLLDTYREDQPVVISTGPLTGTLVPGGALAVLSAFGAQGERLHAPLTQFIGFEAKLSGFDAVVLKGVSPQPVVLWIHDGFAALEDASGLWGKDTWQTADSIKSLKGDQVVQVLSIGPAGERGSKSSQVILNYWASADHDGLAGTLGQKRVKAIAWRGLGIIDVEEPDELFALSVDLGDEVAGARTSKGLVPAAVSAGIAAGPLAEWLEPYVHRHRSCYGCPAACATFAKIDEPAGEMLPSGVAEPGMLLTEPHSLLRLVRCRIHRSRCGRDPARGSPLGGGSPCGCRGGRDPWRSRRSIVRQLPWGSSRGRSSSHRQLPRSGGYRRLRPRVRPRRLPHPVGDRSFSR